MSNSPWTPPGAQFSRDQIRRRAERFAAQKYRNDRAWRQLWPWALVMSALAAWLLVILIGAAGVAIYGL